MKPIDVEGNSYICSIEDVHDKDPKFKVDDHVRISKNKSTFPKRYTLNWSEEVFVIKEVKNTFQRAYVINDLNGKEVS